jgi:FAD/FMN-containing dehydrogenase
MSAPTGTPCAPDAALAELQALLGGAGFVAGAAIEPARSSDWSGHAPVRPLALLRPASTAEVAALAICHRHRLAVVPQGGLTGLAGAAVPVEGAISLALDRMTHIEPPDARRHRHRAGRRHAAGRAGGAAAAGLQFGVDLGARGSCQIGGNLATNAGGNGVIQFGMMREQALGLEVVLADGTVLDMLRPMLKNNTGYDLEAAVHRRRRHAGRDHPRRAAPAPAPRARASVLLALPDFEAAMSVLARLQAAFPARWPPSS